jgi:hypothetical protein
VIRPVLAGLQGSGEIAGVPSRVSTGNARRAATGRSRHSAWDSEPNITMAAEASHITLSVLHYALRATLFLTISGVGCDRATSASGLAAPAILTSACSSRATPARRVFSSSQLRR